MKVYKKIMDGLAMIEKVILSVITVVVTVVTFANVVVRYASDSQFAWSEELVINLFVLMIMMGCALCAREGSLISLSLIFDFLKVKGKKIFVAIITVVNCAFYGVLLYKRKPTLLRIIVVRLIINYGSNVLLGSVWKAMLYGKGYLYYLTSGAIKNTLMLPVEVFLMWAVLNAAVNYGLDRKYIHKR